MNTTNVHHLGGRLVCIIVLVCLNVSGAPVEQWFQTANSWYEKQSYDSAIVYYTKIIGAGIHNSDVYYNVGNAYFRQNQLGKAILFFEKAARLSPRDPDIQANLRFANQSIVDRIPKPKLSLFVQVLSRLHSLFSLKQQLWILLTVLCIVSGCFITGLFVSHDFRLWLIYLGSLCMCIGVCIGFSVGLKIFFEEKKTYAIVLEKSVDAKNQPNGDKILFTIHEGTKLILRSTVEGWSLISLPNGVSGWVENRTFGSI